MKPAMLFCALVLVLPAQAFAGPKGDPKAEGKSKGKIAETALAGAEELLGMGAHIEAQKALAEVDATLAASERRRCVRAG